MRNRLAVKSSFIGLFARVSTILIGLLSSRYFARYLGKECLGLNGVFTNVLGFLQLAELGVGTAITYALYQPVVDKNIREIQLLMQLYKKLYRAIFCIIVSLGVLIIPVVLFFVTDSSYSTQFVIFAYCVNLATTAVTYLLAYKRNLLYADQKQYMIVLIDALVNVFLGVCRIAVIIHTKSYIYCLLVSFAQCLIANIVISIYCNIQYPYLKEPINDQYDKVSDIKKNVRNIMIGKVGGWIYSSTDNLIISKFIGIVMVGLMANYYTLKMMLLSIVRSITDPIQPMIGNYIRENKSPERVYAIFSTYTFIRYIIANLATVCMIIMGNDIVGIWIGDDFVLGDWVVILLAIDLYIGIVHEPMNEFIHVLGLFKDDKNMSLIGMIINLVTSLLFVKILGTVGVLIGTVIAQFYYWIARGSILFKMFFKCGFGKYLERMIVYAISTVVLILILSHIFERDYSGMGPITCMFYKGGLSAIATVLLSVLINIKTSEFSDTVEMIRNFFSTKTRSNVKS